jgi:hypothetical protein
MACGKGAGWPYGIRLLGSTLRSNDHMTHEVTSR